MSSETVYLVLAYVTSLSLFGFSLWVLLLYRRVWALLATLEGMQK